MKLIYICCIEKQKFMRRILTLTDTVNTCDCCNRTNLKHTYVVIDDLGGEFYYGTTCVKNNLGYTKEDIQKDLNKTKVIAQNEYYTEKEKILSLALHPLLEGREIKSLRYNISNKYKIPIYYL